LVCTASPEINAAGTWTNMTRLLIAFASFAFAAAPALAAVDKDGGKPSVNPCGPETDACAGAPARPMEPEPTAEEPMVIFLDAEGNTLVRMPLSRFREAAPDAKLPAQLQGGN
jgi:hypothetical protein